MTNFCSLSNDVICILKPVGPKITLPRVITLPHFQVVDGACVWIGGTLPHKELLIIYAYYVLNGFVIPGGIMMILYTRMGILIFRSHMLQKTMTTKTDGKKKGTLGKAQLNVFFTCVSLMMLFFCCWSWNQISIMMWIGGVVTANPTLFHISAMLVVFNSVINPFVYVIRYEEFQKHLKILILQKLLGRKPEPTNSSISSTQITKA